MASQCCSDGQAEWKHVQAIGNENAQSACRVHREANPSNFSWEKSHVLAAGAFFRMENKGLNFGKTPKELPLYHVLIIAGGIEDGYFLGW